MDVLSAGDLRLDHVEVLGVRHGLGLDRVGLGGRRHQVGRMLGAVDALREALVRQSLRRRGQAKAFHLHFVVIVKLLSLIRLLQGFSPHLRQKKILTIELRNKRILTVRPTVLLFFFFLWVFLDISVHC